MNRAAAASITSNPNPRIFAPDVSDNSNTAESSIRPRNRRLISTEQELVSTSGTSTPAGSRAVSPIPSKYPSRAPTRAGDNKNGRPVGGLVVPGTKGGRGSPQPQGFGGLWEGGWTTSWTALQGLASSVLGVDTEGEEEQSTHSGSLPRKAKKKEAWGPEGLPKREQDAIGVGSVAERDAAVRARRMRGVLEGREDDLNVRKDLTGNYKRRTSTEETRLDGQQDEVEDALVYIHQVQPQDTLAGVILKYNCQPAVFRKANRFWPNDSIQTRKHVVIPVDATTIKGRPCEPPTPGSQGVDLLAPTPSVEDPPFSNGSTWPGLSSSHNETSAECTESEEHPWTHVRWVLIDSSPSSKPVEIARMPRKTLGYFPPRRRKSQNTISTVSTPRGSFDLPRIGESSPNATGSSSPQSRRTSNLGPRPSQPIGGSYFPPIPSSTRSRRESVSDAADRMGWMRGPGGVGTFGKNVRRPGPGQDGLNAWAKKHIPGLAIDDLPSASIVGGESAHFGFNEELGRVTEGSMRAGSGTATPSAFVQGLGGQGLGIENAAAAIEGWVRRLAIKGPGTPKMGGRTAENTDLIELLDGAGSDDGRGFELTPGTMRAPIQGLSGSGREDLNGVVRGKATAGAKGGKSD